MTSEIQNYELLPVATLSETTSETERLRETGSFNLLGAEATASCDRGFRTRNPPRRILVLYSMGEILPTFDRLGSVFRR